MTDEKKKMKKCPVCGHVSEQWNLQGLPHYRVHGDLDSREIEQFCWLSDDDTGTYIDFGRFAHEKLINMCPECGYADGDIENSVLRAEDIALIKSEAYENTDGIDFASDFARAYYRLYMLEKSRGYFVEAFHAVRRAAWACDDAGDNKNADICRVTGAETKDMFVLDDADMEEASLNVIMDMLRRAGRFDEAIEKYRCVSLEGECYRERCEFEAVLAKRRDRRCYWAPFAYSYADLVRKTGDPEKSADEVIRRASLLRISFSFLRKEYIERRKEAGAVFLPGYHGLEDGLCSDPELLKKCEDMPVEPVGDSSLTEEHPA